MKTIGEIYNNYYIMPQLESHMYRVAAVASLICDNFQTSIDKKSIINTCLLHDMGNIIKFDLTKFPEFNEPQGLAYWQSVKNNFIEKYGNDQHKATVAIALEVGVSLRVLELLNSIGFSKSVNVNESNEMEKMICIYSDMRVTPSGVATLRERLIDMEERYGNSQNAKKGTELQDIYLALYSIEEKIFMHASIKPNDITNEICEPIITHLKKSII
ncbi:HD domain-containing protein [Candidatus Nomurabacteria bacterium]|nr:HD domain-containing protein [Candidatus Nomurabacteria bacterium]